MPDDMEGNAASDKRQRRLPDDMEGNSASAGTQRRLPDDVFCGHDQVRFTVRSGLRSAGFLRVLLRRPTSFAACAAGTPLNE